MSFDRRSFGSMLSGSLNSRREHEADVQFAHYVQPWGRYHKVQLRPGGPVITVDGPQQTVAPNSKVPVGSNTGRQDKFIIPSSSGGASAPYQTHHGTIKSSTACPVSLPNRNLIGIVDNTATHTIYAYLYRGGKYISPLGSVALPSILQKSSPDRQGFCRVHPAGDTIAFYAERTDDKYSTVSWEIGSSAVVGDPGNLYGYNGRPIFIGTEIWWAEHWESDTEVRAVRQTVGSTTRTSEGTFTFSNDGANVNSFYLSGGTEPWAYDDEGQFWMDKDENEGPVLPWGSSLRVPGHFLPGGLALGARGMTPHIIGTDQVDYPIWPTSWFETHSVGDIYLQPSSSGLEYAWYNAYNGRIIVMRTGENYYGFDQLGCTLPGGEFAESSPQGVPDAMFPKY